MAWGTPEVASVLYGAGLAAQAWYGIWLSKVVRQKEELLNGQVKAKDATIETLKAQIDKLSKETAPAMATQVKQLSEYAESMAKMLQENETKHRLTAVVLEGDTAQVASMEREIQQRLEGQLLAQRLREMQDTIVALQTETELLAIPAIREVDLTIDEPEPVKPNPYAPPKKGTGFDAFRPQPTKKTSSNDEPTDGSPPNKKKPGFTL